MRLFSSQFILLVLVIVAIIAVDAGDDSDEDNTKVSKNKKRKIKVDEDSDEKTAMSKRNRKPVYKDSKEDSSDEIPKKVKVRKMMSKERTKEDSSYEKAKKSKDSTEDINDEESKKTKSKQKERLYKDRKKPKKSRSRGGMTWSENTPIYGDENYCEILDCGNKHIACKYTIWKPEPPCVEESEYIDMDDLKDMIIKIHNKKRNLVAGGNLGNLKPAVRMATMQWNINLHITATIKAKICSMEPDNCHGTSRFPYSGQNIGMFIYSGPEDRFGIDFIVKNRLENWFEESANCTRKIIKTFPQPENKVGLFTIMIREENDYVGCGINYFKQDNMNRVMFVCHYASNNFIGVPVYKSGDEPGSECKTGTNKIYKNLCSVSEVYHYGAK